MHAAVDRPTRNSRGGRARTTAPQAFCYAGIGRRGSPRAASRAGAPFGLRSESVAVLRARTGNTLCRSEQVRASRARGFIYVGKVWFICMLRLGKGEGPCAARTTPLRHAGTRCRARPPASSDCLRCCWPSRRNLPSRACPYDARQEPASACGQPRTQLVAPVAQFHAPPLLGAHLYASVSSSENMFAEWLTASACNGRSWQTFTRAEHRTSTSSSSFARFGPGRPVGGESGHDTRVAISNALAGDEQTLV